MYQLLVWIHVLAAMTWLGTALVTHAVLGPALRRPEQRERAHLMLNLIGPNLRTLGWLCLAILIPTGSELLYLRGVQLNDLIRESFFRTDFGQAVGLKILLVTAIVCVSLWSELRLGTWPGKAGSDVPKTRQGGGDSPWAARLSLSLGVLVVLLAVFIVDGRPF